MANKNTDKIILALDALFTAAFRTSSPDAADKKLWCELASAAKLSLIEMNSDRQKTNELLLRALVHCSDDEAY